MQKGGWVIGENDEACYIDIDREEYDSHGANDTAGSCTTATTTRVYSRWCDLPDILLEDVFARLTVRDRYYASLVCRRWYGAFYMPRVWGNFVIDDRTMTCAKFNYYSGWQYVLDHYRTQNCLARIGEHLRGLEFRPVHSFNNLYQFMSLIAWYMEQTRNTDTCRDVIPVGGKIRSLAFVFPCNMAATDDPTGVKLFGTGGQLLASLKRLLVNLDQLHTVRLVDLMLERYDANHLLDELVQAGGAATCNTSLRTLHLINVTAVHCPILHIGLFFNLRVLVISPQSVNDDVLTLLADSRVQHLHLLQTRYTPAAVRLFACSARAWRTVRCDNAQLHVHLCVESAQGDAEVLLQPEAPVYSVVYRTPKTPVTEVTVRRLAEWYAGTLHTYGHEMLPRFGASRGFAQRADGVLVAMVRQCAGLRTLIIRERISTATLLLLLKHGRNLHTLLVRRNAVLLRCDWARDPDWSAEYWHWLQRTARSYERTEEAVGVLLGRPGWRMLPDADFKRVVVRVRD